MAAVSVLLARYNQHLPYMPLRPVPCLSEGIFDSRGPLLWAVVCRWLCTFMWHAWRVGCQVVGCNAVYGLNHVCHMQ